ncbi:MULTISPECIES: MFS transporter [unclassified Methylobacterium]|uniref:MFS transporter n=1 Tax=unclassified Methylobacterium TaxID=2615210 RepID=UPI0006F3F8E8|nr:MULTISPECIES: MFS transporter [unclassified Methylobacterium]KQP15521.1 MFS transporter [Methylobacterium sp. Leaf93]TXN41161.1 MFS transporter [Methylobacterium sp. WL93]TXN51435.1 MFS transporter [Methylobacterium sp. WL119]TXN67697.1 MFS transporter [Methylobacterium sp. WL30]
MLAVLANRTYRHLFAAQVIALVGTGLLTVALGLLAYRLAGAEAGAVLGTALAIKMAAYVLVAPIANAFTGQLPRRAFLVATDLVRAGVALILPFVDQVWQVYALVFVLQSCSAAFTPTFQATIPDILPEERDYTRALSLSRLAYDLENLLSPTLAALLLTAIDFHWLFGGTVVGFLCSAAFVVSVSLPSPKLPERRAGIYERTTRGLRIYLATPRLRGLLALNLAVSAAGSMVIVNTVVIVQAILHRSQNDVAIALGLFGGGSMLAALLLPRMLDRLPDRTVMIPAAGLLGIVLLAFAATTWGGVIGWPMLLATWLVLGIGYSAAQTPTGRLLRRSASPGDRPGVFAAQFALSHVAWLVTYPLAGWLGAKVGMPTTLAVLGGLTLAAIAAAALLWPASDPDVVEHVHGDLRPDHPHLDAGGHRHAHAFVIDDLHHRWPAGGPG